MVAKMYCVVVVEELGFFSLSESESIGFLSIQLFAEICPNSASQLEQINRAKSPSFNRK